MTQHSARPGIQAGGAPPPPEAARRLRALVLALGTLAVLAVLAGTVLSLWRMHQDVVRQAEVHLLGLAQVLGEQTLRSTLAVDAVLGAAGKEVRRATSNGRILASEPLYQHLRDTIESTPYVRALLLTDANGRLLIHTKQFPAPPIDYGERKYFSAHRAGGEPQLLLGPPAAGSVGGTAGITVSRRVDDEAGRYLGVLTADVDPAFFLWPTGLHEIGPDGAVRLLRRDGTLLTGYPMTMAAATGNYRNTALFTQGVEAGHPLIHHLGTVSKAERVSAIYAIPDYALVTTVTSSLAFMLEAWRRSAWQFGAMAVVAAMLLGVITLSLARQLSIDEDLKSSVIESEERLRAIIQSAMDAIIITDAGQRVVLFNAAAEQIFRCPGAQAIGAELSRFIPGQRPAVQARALAGDSTGAALRRSGEHLALTGMRSGGAEFPIDASISQVELRGVEHIVVILRDITERQRADQELRRSQQELRAMSKAANEALEAERRRTARELHDELGQSLTALKMDLESLRGDLPPGQPELAERAQTMHALLDETIAATRRIAANLRPLMLDDLGLAAALDWLTHNFSQHTGIATDLVIDDAVAQVPEPIASALYRITQESLTNVAKYAQAGMAEIRLELDGDWVQLLVRDDGSGIKASDQGKRGVFGLLGIRERVTLLGGEVTIKGTPGKGSELCARIPLAAAGAESAA